MKKTKNASRAFTLIEILVVIAIIAVLAAILFPVFARAKESAQATAAIAQAKQLGLGIHLYLDENDQKFLPSTNYGAPETAPERIWSRVLEPQIKSENIFIAPGSDGKFASTWELRGWQTIGYNSSTAYDHEKGCSDDQKVDKCIAFKSVASFSKQDNPAMFGLFAVTPGGEVGEKYLGYEFSAYNGTPADKPEFSPPLCSDRDLVKELGATLPADLIKPIYARYGRTGSDDGSTPVIFGDGHAKEYSAKKINDPKTGIIWRVR